MNNNKTDENTHEKLFRQREQLKELIDKAEYDLVFEDGLLVELRNKITIFDLCMERTIAGGFDPLYEDELKELHLFWHALSQNIRHALELLNAAEYTLDGTKYDPQKSNMFIRTFKKLNFDESQTEEV